MGRSWAEMFAVGWRIAGSPVLLPTEPCATRARSSRTASPLSPAASRPSWARSTARRGQRADRVRRSRRQPGDIIVADADGIAVIRPSEAEEVLVETTKLEASHEAVQPILLRGEVTNIAKIERALRDQGCTFVDG